MNESLTDYDFEFDDARIALRPVEPRGDAKLLVFDGAIHDRYVRDYVDLFAADDLLVFNDTKVLAARLDGVRRRVSRQGEVEAKISVTLLEPAGEAGEWRAMIRPLKKIEIGETIIFGEGFTATLMAKADGMATLRFDPDAFADGLARFGRMPLPPYIEGKRPADAQDHHDYQPFLARNEGAVAAPTASLHFDAALMAALAARNVAHETITLHVGAGTFLPVKDDDISAHKMHAERGMITAETAARINAHKARGGRIVAIGTTALRLLESAAVDGKLGSFAGATDIFIRPGFAFQITDRLVTNFHLPKSTLLMLVAGFAGYSNMRAIYDHALAGDYRFFSYGDSSLLARQED